MKPNLQLTSYDSFRLAKNFLSFRDALFLFISKCSDDELQPGCFQEDGKRVIATITEAEGTIRPPRVFCPNAFTMAPEEKTDSRRLGAFFPVIWPMNFKSKTAASYSDLYMNPLIRRISALTFLTLPQFGISIHNRGIRAF
ncbi:MAG: hypothetical protein AAF717_01135 [Bacteroidota bacterium]